MSSISTMSENDCKRAASQLKNFFAKKPANEQEQKSANAQQADHTELLHSLLEGQRLKGY